MGIVIKQSIRSTIFIYIGAVIGFVNTTLLYPKFLSESQIGALNLIVSYAIIFGFFGTFGFTRAIGKFFPYFRNKREKHRGFVFLILMVGLLGFAVVALIFSPISDWLIERNAAKSPHFVAYIYLIIPLTFIHIFWNLLDTYNSMLYRTIYGISLKEFWLRLIFMLGIALLVFNYIDFEDYILIYSAGFAIVLLALIFHLVQYQDFNIVPRFKFYNKKIMRQMFSWSAYGFMTGMGNFAALKIDIVMINEFIDDAATGIYVTVFNFTILILMPNRGMARIANAIISDAFRANDYEKVEDMYKRSCLTQTIVAVFIFLGLVTNIDNIFRILPSSYAVGYWVIFIVGLANVLRMCSGVSENIIALSNYYRVQTLYIAIYLASIVALNYMLIPVYGLNGAAVASGLSMLLYFFIRFTFLYIKFGFQPYNYKYILILLIGSVSFFLIDRIPALDMLYLDILMRSLLVALLFLLPLYLIKISDDFNLLAGSFLQSLREMFRKK